MKPKRTSWKSGIMSAMASVALSRRMWTNSFVRIATKEGQNVPFMDSRLRGRWPAGCGHGLAPRGGRLLGERHENVLQRGLDLARSRGGEPLAPQAGQDVLVPHTGRHDRMDRLP